MGFRLWDFGMPCVCVCVCGGGFTLTITQVGFEVLDFRASMWLVGI